MLYYYKMLRHFFISNSRHGTHSPFVYKLCDEVIYANGLGSQASAQLPGGPLLRYGDLLKAILGYLDIQKMSIGLTGEDAVAVFYTKEVLDPVEVQKALQQRKVVLIHEPHASSEYEAQLEALIQIPEAIVSIDLFHFAILLHREGQVKEHFHLRYPYWRKR